MSLKELTPTEFVSLRRRYFVVVAAWCFNVAVMAGLSAYLDGPDYWKEPTLIKYVVGWTGFFLVMAIPSGFIYIVWLNVRLNLWRCPGCGRRFRAFRSIPSPSMLRKACDCGVQFTTSPETADQD
jgi:hypothetical protein